MDYEEFHEKVNKYCDGNKRHIRVNKLRINEFNFINMDTCNIEYDETILTVYSGFDWVCYISFEDIKTMSFMLENYISFCKVDVNEQWRIE